GVPEKMLDIENLFEPPHDPRERWRRAGDQGLVAQRAALADVVDTWLLTGGVRSEPRWAPDSSVVELSFTFNKSGQGLSGLLAVQLTSALSSPFGLFVCDGCAYPYTPEKRRPR